MRKHIYFFVAVLLLAFTIESAREISSFQKASSEREYRRAEDLLEGVIGRWENETFVTLTRMLERLPSETKYRSYRRTYRWLDGIYVWEPGALIRPMMRSNEDIAKLRQDPCLMAAQPLMANSDALTAAAALAACIGPNPGVSLLAASDAAAILLDADAPQEAQEVLHRVEGLFQFDLSNASPLGLPVRRLTALRLQYIQALEQQGQPGIAQMQVLANEIANLDAESLEAVIDFYEYPILHSLRDLRDGNENEELARAGRRVQVLREVLDHHWNPDDAPDVSNGPRLYLDPVGDPPYLLFYGHIGDGNTMAGVQADQASLIRELFSRLGPLGKWVSVREPGGRVLYGARGELGPSMAFERILPHLRVGLTMDYLSDNAPPTNLFAQMLPMCLGLITGIAALLGLMHADRQQNLLMEQQREFMARVTHELKTPLAGIRLMAETLEMGAFKDSAQREKFARQIIKEAERLGARVDEVLRAASRPDADQVQAVDIDVLVKEINDRWQQLYEQQGATLILEASPVGTLQTSRSLLRDALYNLLDNALKYRREDRPGKVIFRVITDRRSVSFEVEDNGLGVPSHMRKAVFERFRRVEGPGRGLAGGHGLGLYFVAEAARSLGGKVDCRDGAEGGARFVIKIPRRT